VELYLNDRTAIIYSCRSNRQLAQRLKSVARDGGLHAIVTPVSKLCAHGGPVRQFWHIREREPVRLLIVSTAGHDLVGLHMHCAEPWPVAQSIM